MLITQLKCKAPPTPPSGWNRDFLSLRASDCRVRRQWRCEMAHNYARCKPLIDLSDSSNVTIRAYRSRRVASEA